MGGASGIPDLYGAMVGPDIADALAKHAQDIQAATLGRYQLARQLSQQQQLDAARQAAISNPSAETFNTLFVLDPQSHEAIKSAHDSMDKDQQSASLRDLSAIRGYLTAGRPEEATKLIQRRIEADRAAGHDTADDEQMLSLVQQDPTHAQGLVDYQLAGVMGPDKWSEAFGKIGDSRRADDAQPHNLALTDAQASDAAAGATLKVEQAQQVAPNAASERALRGTQMADLQSQISNRAASLALDREKFHSSVQLELAKLQLDGTKLSGVGEQAVNSAVVNAEASRQLASRANDLATKIQGAHMWSGWGTWLAENGEGAFGNPNLLRKEYTALVNGQAVKNLPPGPASDKDIQLAMKGFPPPTANKETMAGFLRGMAKLQTVAANREQAKADWIAGNGTLGSAKRDLTVNGVQVPAGATFGDFSKSAAATERRAAVPERSYMRFANGGQ